MIFCLFNSIQLSYGVYRLCLVQQAWTFIIDLLVLRYEPSSYPLDTRNPTIPQGRCLRDNLGCLP